MDVSLNMVVEISIMKSGHIIHFYQACQICNIEVILEKAGVHDRLIDIP